LSELSKKVKKFNSKQNKTSDTQNVVELLNEIAYLFKSAEYQYEHEIRLVLKGVGFKKKIDSNCLLPKVHIELSEIRPFIEKITLGPKVECADEWAASFYYSLNENGYIPSILISHLPFK